MACNNHRRTQASESKQRGEREETTRCFAEKRTHTTVTPIAFGSSARTLVDDFNRFPGLSHRVSFEIRTEQRKEPNDTRAHNTHAHATSNNASKTNKEKKEGQGPVG